MDSALAQRLVHRWRTGTTEPPAPPESGEPAGLSTIQRGVVVFERLQPGTAVFNLAFAARHAGPLDEARFDTALGTLAARHPALRARITGADVPIRTTAPPAPLRAVWVDLRHLPEADRDAAARAHADRAAAEPFDLDGMLVRVHGYRLADDRRLLLFLAHHLVCDGISMQVLLDEMDAAYRGELAGTMPDAVPAPADPSALDFWRAHLAGVAELDLPADRQLPARLSFTAGSVPFALPDEVVGAAGRLGRDEGATLFMVLLAAYQLSLGEQSGQTDFVVGVPEAGRSGPGQHRLVGLLADMLAIRADLSGRPTFRDLVGRARATCLAAFTHRGVPHEDVVAALGPGRRLDTTLIQAGFVLHGERAGATLAGAVLEPAPISRPGLRHAVEVHLWREHGSLRGVWDYSTQRYEPATAARMAAQFVRLLTRALAEPDRPVDQLDLLADEDRALLAQWGNGPALDGPATTLTALFAARVAENPDAVAVADRWRELTYRRLDERSNQLARLLRGRGAGPGSIVGIRLARTVDLAVAMLGIHKVGAAYLPLDPAYPADRTAYMLDDSGAGIVVTADETAALDVWPADPVAEVNTPDSLAYVLYTSGSTGRPKGVLLTHHNATAMTRWARRRFTAHELSRVLASTSICFDVSVFEFFATLCAGGTVVVVDNALSLLTEQPAVTFLSAVPTAVRALAEARAIPPSVRVVGLGGEAVTGTIVDDLYAIGTIESVINLYGPTEDTTYSTSATLLAREQPPPIGRLLPGGRGYVLDRALRPVPPGAVGELYLAGAGLSRGYAGNSALTAARYLPDPFTSMPGERMYRTGDLARFRADGALLYLGRRDFQIKIRGQRIELGEIETTLQRHPGVREAVVTLHDNRLIGYLSPPDVDLDDVRAHLRNTLPVVMVPSLLIALDALPQTPNGKVDRLALPVPQAPATTGGGTLRGPDEELVAGVWRDVLDVEAVGRDDDFFDLGGDSLLAGQVLSRLRERAGGGLSLRLIFEHSRLADLAAALPPPGDPAPEQPSAVTPRSAGAAPVLSFDQERMWLESISGRNVAYNIHGRQWLDGPLDVAALQLSIGAIVARHESLRTRFPVVDGRPTQQVGDPDPGWRLPILEAASAADAEALADVQARVSFDLAAGPLFACLLVRTGDDSHLLSLTIHHIVSDGWSVALILGELSALYACGGDPDAAGLPPLAVQYRDYAVWQRDTLAGDRLARQVQQWRDRLAGAPEAMLLPQARRRSPAPAGTGGRVRATSQPGDAAALRRLCREHDVTAFMAVLAAWSVVLHRWSGQDDLVIGVPVNTRSGAAGTEPLVGLFVNTVPVRIDAGGDPPWTELLTRVRRAALDSYVGHGETPFHVLVRELGVVRDPSRTPVFQVMLNMIEAADRLWRLPGLTARTPEHPPQPGKVDISLDVLHDDGELTFDLSYHAGRYDAATMRALLGQVQAVLRAGAADPGRPVRAFDLAPAGIAPAAVHLTPARLRASAGPFPPAVRQVFVHHHGDMLAHDVALARRLAPAATVVALFHSRNASGPAGVHIVPETWSARTAPMRVPIGVVGDPAPLLAPGETGALATGEPVRRRFDGEFEYAAPLDDPLETVAALLDLPGVTDAAVAVRDGQGTVAYVTGTALDLGRIRQYLVKNLPEYLVPDRVVPVARFPLTGAGHHDLAELA
ncbi:amino acid adenylation domain-containing protein [Actinoplanes sp. NPDC026670]|uniref:amino acid adenylation domain-containing protein n=1 Tax=Actinoplanes sp. NPDC026670 TaxID=3154700 RepID=UPI0034108D65